MTKSECQCVSVDSSVCGGGAVRALTRIPACG